MRSGRRLFAVLIAALSVVFTSIMTAVPAAAEPAKIARYVALGDSYTAGPLIPVQRLDPLGCFRSTSNYPSLLARHLGVTSFTDVSCSGADTTHMTQPQQVLLGVNRPQFSALTPDTDLVTVGIGGNDYSVFGRIIETCPELRESDPTGAPCQEHFTVDGVDVIKAAITSTGRNVATVLAGIRERAPHAEVLAIGYPRIAPPAGTCPDVLPFADGDYVWLGSVEEALNAAIEKAAADEGATFVDLYPASLGHDACAGDDAWIQGKDTGLTAASYHPRRPGMAGVAAEVLRVVTGS